MVLSNSSSVFRGEGLWLQREPPGGPLFHLLGELDGDQLLLEWLRERINWVLTRGVGDSVEVAVQCQGDVGVVGGEGQSLGGHVQPQDSGWVGGSLARETRSLPQEVKSLRQGYESSPVCG